MIKTVKVAFVMAFKISRDIQIMAKYDKIVIKSDISKNHFKHTSSTLIHFYNEIKSTDHNLKTEALKSLYRSPGNKKKQLVLCKNYVLQW